MALTDLWGLYIGGGIYLLFNVTVLAVYLSRRHLEPIKSRGWQVRRFFVRSSLARDD